MKIPAIEFLENIEHFYSASFPTQYKPFCDQLRNAKDAISGRNNGQFIVDVETFQSVNVSIGEGQWGDYERAIAGKQHPKGKHQLWGGLLPFYFDANDIYGFSVEDDRDEQVYVWSAHTIVHAYPSLAAFAEAVLGNR